MHLRLSIPIAPPSPDPRKSSDWIAPYFHFATLEGLTRICSDGSLALALAESVDISTDQLRYTFRLRESVWSNGAAITAEDFAHSWAKESPDSYLLAAVDRVEPLDKRTLLVTLRKPTPHFLEIVATSPLLPFRSVGLSNGAFCLEGLTLHKNPLYRNADKVQLQQISFSLIPDRYEALEQYLSGELDILGSPLSMFSLPRTTPHPPLHFPAGRSRMLFFNTQTPLLRQPTIRRALSYTLQRRELVAEVLHSGEIAAEVAAVDFDKNISANGLSLLYLSESTTHQVALTLQRHWATNLNISVALEQVDFTTLHERIQAGSFSMVLLSIVDKYRSPINRLERFQDPTCPRNYCRWDSPPYCQLLDYGQLAEAKQLLAHEVPFTPLYHSPHSFLIAPHVKGFAVSPLGTTYLEEIFIEN
jgi:oligopeptide transport system substrate-binding protein